MSTETTDSAEVETYSEMFDAYIFEQDWIGPADQPFVFHVRQLCRQLDSRVAAGAEVKAATWSAYLQAMTRLDRRRPDPTPSGDGLVPEGAQPSIFDTMD